MGTKKQLADLGAVASGLAHEIRNPLNSLHINSQLIVEMLEGMPEPARHGELLSLARSNLKVTQRLSDLLADFLRYARPPSMELVVSDMNRIVSETIRFIEVDFSRRGVELVAKLHPEPVHLFADEKQLRQALLNLLLNADEAMDKERKKIVVSTGYAGGRPFVRVQDNGRGIPAGDRSQVFRLFFTTRKNGSGLGLPIVRQIVRDHGGKISIRSREGRGTTVTVTLPSEAQQKAKFSGGAGKSLLPDKVR
ncbi:MAG: HAMP domain-containing histidine kinase [Deltaproteobacteria bacterium]|nr:HAMP domain-containing histidine kinase [Deltaproteobacteria bacterium]